MTRRSKLVSVADAAALVRDGDHLALGGIWSHNAPTALARAVTARRLTLSASPAAGYAIDALIASGGVTTAYLPNVTFEHLGLARAFRRAVESGALRLIESDEATLVGGYRAAAAGLPYQPVQSIVGSALLGARPDVVDGRVPALAPDVVFLHAQEGDEFGNVRHFGAVFCDKLLAKAAQRAVVVSVDRLISNEEVRANPRATTIPSLYVTHVVEASARPCSSHGLYEMDEEAIAHA